MSIENQAKRVECGRRRADGRREQPRLAPSASGLVQLRTLGSVRLHIKTSELHEPPLRSPNLKFNLQPSPPLPLPFVPHSTTDNTITSTMLPASPSKFVSVCKGKTKATESDYEDLNPVITYRHLHSHNLGVKDPLRVVSLCDSDAFYAACEHLRLGIDPEKPLVVLQWQALIAVNYPARKYGISRMDKLQDAKKRCPQLEVVHVATYKEGEAEPGYWENPDTLTHKVRLRRLHEERH